MRVDGEGFRMRSEGNCNTKRELKSYVKISECRYGRRNARKNDKDGIRGKAVHYR